MAWDEEQNSLLPWDLEALIDLQRKAPETMSLFSWLLLGSHCFIPTPSKLPVRT